MNLLHEYLFFNLLLCKIKVTVQSFLFFFLNNLFIELLTRRGHWPHDSTSLTVVDLEFCEEVSIFNIWLFPLRLVLVLVHSLYFVGLATVFLYAPWETPNGEYPAA